MMFRGTAGPGLLLHKYLNKLIYYNYGSNLLNL
ncbi:hypothetical protein J3B00_003240 [Pseudomonas sp. BP8]|nr:hypothetical protein [Pseudomonas sp. BP8]